MKSIAYITDLHVDEEFPMEQGVNAVENLHSVLQELRTMSLDAIVYGGDIGELRSNKWFFETMQTLSLPLWITLGNHDQFSEVRKHYTNNFLADHQELYYCFEDDSYKYIFLDSSSNSISAPQLQWLRSELTSPKTLLLFVHHPLLEVDTPVDKLYALQGRESLRDALAVRSAHTHIFCGHYHMEDVQHQANISQYICPALSYQVQRNSDEVVIENDSFAYRLIHLDKGTVDTQLRVFRL